MTEEKLGADLEKAVDGLHRVQGGWDRLKGKTHPPPDTPPVGAYSEDAPEAHKRNRAKQPPE